MRNISLIDTGEFTNEIGISSPRTYRPLRELASRGEIKLQDIAYVKSPIRGKPLDEEDTMIYHERQETRQNIEKARVERTATNYSIAFKDPLQLDQLAEVVCFTQRPGEERNNLLEVLIQHNNIQRILLSPPYFRTEAELSKFIDLDINEKVVLWVPYRYASGVAFAKGCFPRRDLAAASLRIVSAPYPQDEFISEFCLPWIDAYLSVLGRIREHHIEKSTANGLPVYSITARHGNENGENGVVSSILLSTAGASFQNTDHCTLNLFSVKMESIELTNSLCRYRHLTPEIHKDSGVPSHDAISSDRNGAWKLLRACIDDKKNEAALSTFRHTQAFIAALLEATTEED